MKNKNVMLLVAVGAVLAALAWMTSREQVPAGANRIGRKLLPELAVNAVDEIIFATATQTVRVARVENAWVLPDRFGYAANFETIRSLMLKLADLKIGQAFKAGDRQRAQMELTPEAATTLMLKAGGNTLVELRLGASRQAANAEAMPYGMGGMTDGRYLAIKDDPMAYLVAESLHEAVAEAKRWMDTSLLDVSAEDVTAITLTNPEDGTFSLVKSTDGKLGFETPVEGKPFDDTKAYSLTGALSYMTLQDVADPSATDEALGFTAPRTFSVATTNGTQYNLRVSDPIKGSDERYVRIAVAFNAPTATDEATTNETAAAAMAETNRETEAAAKALHVKLSPWTFRIAGYKASAMISTRESLVKQPEPPAAAVEAANPTDLTDQTDPTHQTDPTDPTDQPAVTPAQPAEQPATPNQPEPEETTDEQ